ncbi:MAG TPA: cytochrome c biogenesis CcdA family protein [Methanocella sp.]|uniref:cytochrome c biogenesis CcdA family protein n=1 Tax=Methanocella sp. TaxID=2052833 RepID=UPI002C9AF8C1|nr:cytochrome c biogenesis CcdA family protein [Methanocella sp.]HTY90720.1 cytochrome c biogenesis CcdA family protein [Methanocella sp.]
MPSSRDDTLRRFRSYYKFAISAALVAFLLLAPAAGICAGGDTVRVTYIYSPLCSICEHSGPTIRAAVNDSMRAGIDVRYAEYSVSSAEGRGYMERYGLGSVPAVIVGDMVIGPKEFGGDAKKLESRLKHSIYDASHYKRPVSLERKILKNDENGTVSVVTCAVNTGDEPVYASVQGGTCEGVRVIRGETAWEGWLMPGEKRYTAYEADIVRDIRSLPPQTMTYRDSLGDHILTGQETRVFILKKLSFVAVFLAGLVAGFNPCLLAVMAFVSAMALSLKGRRLDIIFNLLAFSTGLLCVYLLMGIGFLGLIEAVPAVTVFLKTGIVILLASLAAFAFYEAWQVRKSADRGSLFRAFVDRYRPVYKKYCLAANFGLGGAFGLIKMPCVGGIYVGILGAIAGSEEVGRGFLFLAAYNLGVVLPVLALGALLVLGLSPEQVDSLRKKHRCALKLATGLILAAMAAGFMLNVI